jgi:hypothetical protein
MLGEVAPAPEGVDIQKLLSLANAQQVYSLFYPPSCKRRAFGRGCAKLE